MKRLTTLELCAGGGGQALGLEQAGIDHVALVEWDRHACATLRLNRPKWNVVQTDIHNFDATRYEGVDIVSGGLPCPPFSVAGKQLGDKDERNLFPAAIRIISEAKPRAVMIENVRGILDAVFCDYRLYVEKQLTKMGYRCDWHLFNASDFGVPQLRPRVVFVAVRKDLFDDFSWPTGNLCLPPTVGEVLHDLIAAGGWKGAKLGRREPMRSPDNCRRQSQTRRPDLGPTRAKRAWATLDVDGHGVADAPPRGTSWECRN